MPHLLIEERRRYRRERYARMAETIKRQNDESRQRQMEALRDSKRSLSCERCGFDDWRALQFHHLRDNERSVAQLANGGVGLARIMEEIEKCQVLCANCHVILHAEERGQER